jgi:acetyl-CoA carboxylase biotin carboxyl carrier protein
LTKNSWDLSDDEVRQIGRIIKTLNESSFDFLQMEVGELKLTLSKGPLQTAVAVATTAGTAAPASPAALQPETSRSASASAEKTAASATQADGMLSIVASLIGRFYLRPEPSAPPFVQVGSEVSDDSTVGLIEVMKTFNALQAGVSGIITEICVEDTALVEYGQVLFHVWPKN